MGLLLAEIHTNHRQINAIGHASPSRQIPNSVHLRPFQALSKALEHPSGAYVQVGRNGFEPD